jgi:hypothetical protein
MSNVIRFEDLPVEAVTEACREAYEETSWAFERAIDKAINFGRLLCIAKTKVPHGKWISWVAETFEDQVSLRNIQRFMQVAESNATNPSLLEGVKTLDEALGLIQVKRTAEETEADEPDEIAVKLAAEFGVTREQIIRDGEFAEAIDEMKPLVPDVMQRVRSGEVTQNDVFAAAKVAKSSPEKARRIVTSGKPKKPAKAQPVASSSVVKNLATMVATLPTGESQPEFDLDEETTRITDAMEKHLDNWPNMQWGSKAYRFLCTNVGLCIGGYTEYPRTTADELLSQANAINDITSRIRAMMGNIPESDRAFVWREIVDSLSAQNPEHWTCKSTDSQGQ